MAGKPITAGIERIAKECSEAGASKWTITKIVKELGEADPRDSGGMRQSALQLLQQLDPKAASIYASFQRMQVRTSSQTIEGFDRGNIIKSLLRETDVARGVAEKIGREVEDKIKDLGIENTNTALIREMVNVKLLEYGHGAIRNQYTRLGLPVFEVKKKIGRQPYSNKAILTEYNLLAVIPPKLARAHLQQELYIAALADFSTKPVALGFAPRALQEPKETALDVLRHLHYLSAVTSWLPNINYLNAALSVNAKRGKAREAAEIFFKGAEAVFLKKPAVEGIASLCLFEPEGFENSAEKSAMAGAANRLLSLAEEQNSFPFRLAVAVDSKYKLKLLNRLPGKMLVVNNSSTEFSLLNGIPTGQKGLCSFLGFNLLLDALGSRGNETGFFEALGEKAAAVKKLDNLKREQLAKRPYLQKRGINAGEMPSAIGLYGLAESAASVLQEGSERERLALCEKTVAELREGLGEKFILTELRNRHALHLFARKNRKVFGEETGGEEKGLGKSSYLQKNYSFTAKAQSRQELNRLIDSNARIIEFRNKPEKK